MPQIPPSTTDLLGRLRAGDPDATNSLLVHTVGRLRSLAGRMLSKHPQVGRWEQPEDVLQNALVRLCRALKAAPPVSARHYYNLAALQLRRELLDLADRHLGPHGAGANHHSDPVGEIVAGRAGPGEGPDTLEGWAAFHQLVGSLPPEEQETFGLIWYQGLTQEEAADVLGVSVKTVKRRWQAARLALARRTAGETPGPFHV